jgi:hypothetical protein
MIADGLLCIADKETGNYTLCPDGKYVLSLVQAYSFEEVHILKQVCLLGCGMQMPEVLLMIK